MQQHLKQLLTFWNMYFVRKSVAMSLLFMSVTAIPNMSPFYLKEKINIAAAEARKVMESANLNASCSRKGILHTARTPHCTLHALLTEHCLYSSLHTARTPRCTLHAHLTEHCLYSSLHTARTLHCTPHAHLAAHCTHSSLHTACTPHCTLHAHLAAHCTHTSLLTLYTGSTKRLKKEEQAQQLPLRSDEPGFSWYKKICCQLQCPDCGITARFDSTVDVDSVPSPVKATHASEICNCEFDCRNYDGSVINVAVKVKTYCEQERSGSFQKEMEEVVMTLPEFKKHFIKCAKKYLIRHFNDIMSSQARRNMYEKMITDKQLSTTIILASDTQLCQMAIQRTNWIKQYSFTQCN